MVLGESNAASSPFADIGAARKGVFLKELRELDPDGDALEHVSRHGLRGGFLDSPLSASGSLDTGELRDFRDHATALGVELGVGLGSFNPVRPERSRAALTAGAGDPVEGVKRMISAASELKATAAMLVVGTEEDRFSPVVSWNAQLGTVVDVFAVFARHAVDAGVQLVVKTHQELTSWDALRILDGAPDGSLQVAFDPTNVIVRMEDPVEAARRLAGRIRQVHVDDAALVRDAGGLHRALTPVLTGSIDWAAVVRQVLSTDPDVWWWGEMHRAELHMPYASEGWFAHHPEISPREFSRWLTLGIGNDMPSSPLVGDVPERIRAVIAALAAPSRAAVAEAA